MGSSTTERALRYIKKRCLKGEIMTTPSKFQFLTPLKLCDNKKYFGYFDAVTVAHCERPTLW